MYLPAGYSSNEDSDDEYSYYSKTLEEANRREPTEEEKRQTRIALLDRHITYGNKDEIMKILSEGFDVDTRLRDDWTLLLFATASGNADIAIELIKHGADVNLDRDGTTPLMNACGCPQLTAPFVTSLSIVKCLVENKADLDRKNRKRMTAFLCAASVGNLGAVEYLLPLVEDKHAEDNQGWTALFWSINGNSYDCVRLLIDAGLHQNKYDVRRFKPIDYAKQNGLNEIVDLLPDPDRGRRDKMIENMQYVFTEEIQRPAFTRDICIMLHGMKCDRLVDLFVAEDMDLLRFLTLREEDLQELGIKLPYQRNRILGGLYRFHKHSYNRKSVPIVPKDKDYSSVDLAKGSLAALRHIITAQAALRYLKINFHDWDRDPHLFEQLKRIEDFTKAIEQTVRKLKVVSKKWDAENESADLITYRKYSYATWLKWTAVLAAGIILIVKCR